MPWDLSTNISAQTSGTMWTDIDRMKDSIAIEGEVFGADWFVMAIIQKIRGHKIII